MITHQLLAQTQSYNEYRALLEKLLSQNKTTGTHQSEEFLNYAKLNLQRMHRLEKTTVLTEHLRSMLSKLRKSYVFLVLTEGWCGDAAQNLPVFHVMEQASPFIELKLLLRDEHLDLMDQYLTNGSRSIPKLICLEKESLQEQFVWGPRPAELQKRVLELLAQHVSKEEKGLIVQKWYAQDKTQSVQRELLEHLNTLT